MGSLSRVLVFACAVSALAACLTAADGPDGAVPLPAGAADATTDPVAVISPLPETISNGTRYELNASGSWDPGDGLIINYTWQIAHGDSTWYLHGRTDFFWFREEGLYKITLTVTDLWGNSDDDFTAVISVDDSDFDGMPDWWEVAYLDTLDEEPSGDFDGDGYTNLQEYAGGTDPSVEDPPPPGWQFLEDNWMYVVAVAAAIVLALAAMVPGMRRRRKEREAKKIKFAIELEKTLDED